MQFSDIQPGDTISYKLQAAAAPRDPERLWHGRVEYVWQSTQCLKVRLLDEGYEDLPEIVRFDQIVSSETERENNHGRTDAHQ